MLGYSVGFMSPTPDINAPENPSYKQVCSKTTSHVEVLHIRFNNKVTTYEELVKFLFTFHDPTTFNRQKQDKGPQYASTIFYHSEEQRKIAEEVKEKVQDLIIEKKIPQAKFESFKVTTKIAPASTYYPAHDEHQEYLFKKPNGYCNHRYRFHWGDVE